MEANADLRIWQGEGSDKISKKMGTLEPQYVSLWGEKYITGYQRSAECTVLEVQHSMCIQGIE